MPRFSPFARSYATKLLGFGATVLVGIAAIVLTGRFAGITRLVTLSETGVPMAFVTAVGLLIAGFAFAAYALGHTRVGAILSAMVSAGGMATLFIYAFAESLHLGPPFVYNPKIVARGIAFDGRMSPNAAACFVLLGFGLWLLGRTKRQLGLILVSAVILQSICFASLCGYVYGLKSVASWWRFTGMSFPTAAAFVTASVVLLGWTRHYAGRERRSWSGALPFFSCAVGVTIVVALIAWISASVEKESDRSLAQTYAISVALVRLEAGLASGETQASQLPKIAETEWQQIVRDLRKSSEVHLRQIESAAAEGRPLASAATLREIVERKLEQLSRGSNEPLTDIAAGGIPIKSAHDYFAALISSNEAQLLRSVEATEPLRSRSSNLVVGGSMLSAALLIVALIVLHRSESEKLRIEAALVAANSDLEHKVQARTVDLTTLNTQLLESESSFRALAESMPQIVWTTLGDGRQGFFNKQWFKYTGMDESHSRDATIAVIHEEDRAACLEAWDRARKSQESFTFEVRLRRHDGIYRWFLARSVPQFDPRSGQVAKWIGTSTDIHDHKLAAAALEVRVAERTHELAEAKLQLQQALLRKRRVLDRIQGMLYEYRVEADGKASCPFVSSAVSRIFGVQPDQVYADVQVLFGMVHPDDLPQLNSSLAQSAQTLQPFRCEFRIRSRDGAEKWLLSKAEPERCADGTVVWYGHVTDVTQDKAIESALQESNDRFRSAFESAGIGMALVSPEGRFIRVNTRLCEIVGYPSPELLTKSFQDITHTDDLEVDLKHVQKLLAGESQYYHLEKRYRHRDGHIVWVNLTVSLVTNRSGEPLHFVSQVEDVTDRKTLEARLAAARDQALATARAKSAFLANMSHEIRTPMNGIIGISGLLMDTPLSAEQRELARLIQHSGDNLVALINDILDFSKLEAGKFRIDPAPFDLRSTVEETAALLAGGADQKGLELVCDIDPRLDTRLLGDSGRIRQVMTNLIGNAIKFTSSGEVVVRIRAEAQTPTYSDLYITIKDSGIGISATTQAQLFEPFTQADAATNSRFGGTGLGLAISRQLVTLMGGTIGVESELNHGATFWVRIRLARVAAAIVDHETVNPPAFRVLIVEDNAESGAALVHQVTALGATAVVVTNGDEALRELRKAEDAGRPFGFALIDWRLGDEEGFEVARRIRVDCMFAPTRLVFLGPSGPDRIVDFAQKFDASLVKPVSLGALHRCIRRLSGALEQPTTPPFRIGPVKPVESSGSGLRILLVEDNATNQVVASGMLKKLGHRVQIAMDGAKALACLSAQSFDLILMDCQMPILDGYETTRLIRRGAVAGLHPQIPVVALTASIMPEDRKMCAEAGMDDYVSKPIRLKDLEAAISRCMSTRAS